MQKKHGILVLFSIITAIFIVSLFIIPIPLSNNGTFFNNEPEKRLNLSNATINDVFSFKDDFSIANTDPDGWYVVYFSDPSKGAGLWEKTNATDTDVMEYFNFDSVLFLNGSRIIIQSIAYPDGYTFIFYKDGYWYVRIYNIFSSEVDFVGEWLKINAD